MSKKPIKFEDFGSKDFDISNFISFFATYGICITPESESLNSNFVTFRRNEHIKGFYVNFPKYNKSVPYSIIIEDFTPIFNNTTYILINVIEPEISAKIKLTINRRSNYATTKELVKYNALKIDFGYNTPVVNSVLFNVRRILRNINNSDEHSEIEFFDQMFNMTSNPNRTIAEIEKFHTKLVDEKTTTGSKTITVKVPARKTSILIGKENTRLTNSYAPFVSVLPVTCLQIEEAKNALKPSEIISSNRPFMRQGEWYFCNLLSNEIDALNNSTLSVALDALPNNIRHPSNLENLWNNLFKLPFSIHQNYHIPQIYAINTKEKMLFTGGAVVSNNHDTLQLSLAKTGMNSHIYLNNGTLKLANIMCRVFRNTEVLSFNGTVD